MPTFNNTTVTDNTALPVFNDATKTYTSDQKQSKFFDNFYNKDYAVDPNDYDLIRGFLQQKKIPESSIDNLAITLADVAKEQGLSATEVIDFSNTDDDIELNTIFCILLNTTRNRTSILGYRKNLETPVQSVQRTVLP